MKTQNKRIVGMGCLSILLFLCSLNAQDKVHHPIHLSVEKFRNACISREVRCTPASIINSMQFGRRELENVFLMIPGKSNSEKLDNVVRRLEKSDSSVFRDKKLCGEDGIVFAEDMADCYNCILREFGSQKTSVCGEFANKLDGESTELHLRRLHSILTESITSGVPPLALFTSYVTEGSESERNIAWKGRHGHTVLIVSVNALTESNSLGFAFRYVDPFDGRLNEGYAHIENRPFSAPIGSNPATVVQLHNSPYLAVAVPAMGMGVVSLEWHRRSLILLQFVVGDFTPSETRTLR